MDPEERIVHYALERLFHGEAEVDLSTSVREAWERGVRGPSLDELDWDQDTWSASSAADHVVAKERTDTHDYKRSTRMHLFPTYAGVAAAVLLLALGAVWLLSPGARPESVASFSRNLPGMEDGRWVPDAQEWVGDGGAVWVDGLEPASVALECGGSLEVDPGSLFTVHRDLDGTRVDLEWGSLQARADAASPLWLSSSGTTVALAAGGVLEANLEWERPSPSPDDLHLVEPTRSRNSRGGLGLLSLRLVEGEARLPALTSATLERGQALRVALEIKRPRTLHVDEGLRLAREFEHMFEVTGRNWDVAEAQLTRTQAWGYRPDQEFLALAAELREEQAHWLHLRQLLQDRLANPDLPAYVRSEILSLLALDGGPVANALAMDVWSRHPEWFKVDQVVALAESGLPVFEREMDSIAVQSDSFWIEQSYLEELGLEELGTMKPILPAVYLALRGNDVGLSLVLETANESGETPGRTPGATEVESLTVLAAVALRRFDIQAPWEACRARLERAVLESLDEDDLESAIDQVLDWEYLAGGHVSSRPPRISFLPLRLAQHRARRRAASLTHEDVRALVEQLLSR